MVIIFLLLLSSATSYAGQPKICEIILAQREAFAKADKDFDLDPESLTVFADKLESDGVSYGTFLSLRLNAVLAKGRGDLMKYRELSDTADTLFANEAKDWVTPELEIGLSNKKQKALDSKILESELRNEWGHRSVPSKISERVIFNENGRITGLRFRTLDEFLKFFEQAEAFEVFKSYGMDSLEVDIYGIGGLYGLTDGVWKTNNDNLVKGFSHIEKLAHHGLLKKLAFTSHDHSLTLPEVLVERLSQSTVLHENITHLGIRTQALCGRFRDEWEPVTRAIAKFKKLQALDLNDTVVPPILARSLNGLRDLRALNINARSHRLDSRDDIVPLDLRPSRKTLKQVTFLEMKGTYELSVVLRNNENFEFSRLEHLGLSNSWNYYGPKQISDFLEKKTFPRLRSVALGNIHDAVDVKKILVAHPDLEVIVYEGDVSRERFKEETFKSIRAGLAKLEKKYPKLRVVR